MKLSIFTLNVWGLKYVSKNRTARIKALADSLIDSKYDVVCLQELWCEEDYKYLKQFCKLKFKYIHYFHSGMLGSGMSIMSCYPIIDIHYHSFLLNGYLHMVLHGDWFGGKGIGLCRINVRGFIVDVYTTHLHACYDYSNDKYIRHRIIQAFETANFIRITSNGSDLAVLAGDLNSEPNDLCYKLISLGANMKDCYSKCLANSVEYTFNHSRNSYENPKKNKERIDYIMYKYNKKNLVIVKEHRYSLPSRIPGQNFSFSDHEPIEAIFEITVDKLNSDRNIDVNTDYQIKNELQEVINTSLKVCNENSVINPLVSFKFYTFFIIILLFTALFMNEYCSVSNIVIIIFFLKIIWIYSLVTKSIELNCVRGFCHQISTLFYDQ